MARPGDAPAPRALPPAGTGREPAGRRAGDARRHPRATVLVTGFAPFAGLPRNPSADVVRRLAVDAACRRAGVRTAVLPVHRHGAPAALERCLGRHRPAALVLTGLARGRDQVCVERIGINCYRRAGDRGPGRRIVADGPDGLFATIPLEEATRALAGFGPPVALSESAGTFTCNLVLYLALLWGERGLPGGGRAPGLVAFVHLPPTPESVPDGTSAAAFPTAQLARSLRSLALHLARQAG